MFAIRYLIRAVLCTVFVVTVLCLSAGIAQAASTWGNLSTGKFYRYSTSPSSSYPDRWPVNISGTILSDGVKLTDDVMSSTDPTDGSWTGWYQAATNITIDLGTTYAVSDMNVSACSMTSWGIYFPSGATIWYSTNGSTYTQYGGTLYFGSNTSGFSTHVAYNNPGYVNARYIKLSLPSNGAWCFINEIYVHGTVPNADKLVPSSGCYHGCYHISSQGYLDIDGFEAASHANRHVKMALWYADWSGSFADEIGDPIDNHYAANLNHGQRYPELGWLPYNTTSASIAQGDYDSYLYTWFTDCAAKDYPIWIRPMNEMNGAWTWENSSGYLKYGGDAQKYKWAWRRMYNIAEKVGCTGTNQIFVWSPDLGADLSGGTGTDMTLYYPGDQYTDWIGCSCYAQSPGTSSFLDFVSRWYSLYYNKPLMIAEGGSAEATNPDWKGDTWMNDWFYDIQYWYPQIKAFVWYDNANWAIDTNSNSLSQYQAYDQNTYYIGW